MDRLSFITEYLSKTSYIRKLMDVLLIAVLIIVWGFASGKLHLPPPTPHTVKASFNISREIQKVLDIEQNRNDVNFIGHYNFHNGTQSLSGFNFIKYSLSEYSAKMGVHVDTVGLQNVPIVSNMALVGTLLDNKCYSSPINPNKSTYLSYLAMNVQTYTACPKFDRNGALIGFVLFGVNEQVPPHESIVREAVLNVTTLRLDKKK